MLKYPSRAVEQTRESIYHSNNPLETVLLLTCLVKNGMRDDKKNNLISECISCSSMDEEEIITLYQLLNVNTIFGFRKNPDQKRLGCEPNGNYRHEEYLVGKAIEYMLGVRLYRSETPMFDFTLGKENWELVGPVAPFYFDSNSFVESLSTHLSNKKGMDTLVVCTLTLPLEDQEEIANLLKNDKRCNEFNVLVLDNNQLISQNFSSQGFSFLC